jgi:very-short-patch-repair endonuclease
MSYLENWFQEEVILKNSLQEKHQIITEYHVGGYFVDFAFLDKMIAVEIDGRCHFDKNMKRNERDFKKDEVLKNLGWNVIRMNFHDIRHNHEMLVENFLNLLDSNDSRSCEWFGQIRYAEYKKTQKKMEISSKIKFNHELNLKRICEIKSSNIDFTKRGWVQQASKIIGITPQKTRSWFSNNMPDSLEQAFKRK